MKKMIKFSVAGLLLVIGTVSNLHAQYLVQPLNVALTVYDATSNRSLIIGTRQLVRYFLGTNVPNPRLYLVTPVGNEPGTIGNLNAFLRIANGTNVLAQIPSPDQFNIFQDVAKLRTRGLTTTSRAINRFSFDTSGVRAEFQGFSLWTIIHRTVNGVDLSGTGTFRSTVNGWILIYGVTDGAAPVTGAISAGYPVPGS